MLRCHWIGLISVSGAVLLAGAVAASPMPLAPVPASGGNPADPETGFGAVGSDYWIGVTEVTNTRYTEFLNAVATTDSHGLYAVGMGSDAINGGIVRSGGSSNYTYAVKPGFGNKPVTYVSFWSSLRFANWMNNGMGSASTENGAYTLTAASIAANTVSRNPGAVVFLPNEDEWYKAAYYDPLSGDYFDFPAGANTAIDCESPGSAPNTANCFWWTTPPRAVDVAGYTGSASPFGTYDQGGNVREWIETVASSSPGALDERRLRGGDFDFNAIELSATHWTQSNPSSAASRTGFRVASVVPEPSTALLLGLGLATGALFQRSRRSERRTAPGSLQSLAPPPRQG